MAIKRRNKVSPEFSMSSLTDIIFLLLIFFMLTSSLVKINPKNLELPEASQKTTASHNVSISVTKDGTFFLGTDKISSRGLKRQITRAIRKDRESTATPTIIIVPEKGTPFRHVAKIMTVARELRMNPIIATQPKDK